MNSRDAQKEALKLRYPASRLDKLGVKDTSIVSVLAQGLVDIKVMSFSDTLSGLKLVIPVAQRKRR